MQRKAKAEAKAKEKAGARSKGQGVGNMSRDLKVGAIQMILFLWKSERVIQMIVQFSLMINDSRLTIHCSLLTVHYLHCEQEPVYEFPDATLAAIPRQNYVHYFDQ